MDRRSFLRSAALAGVSIPLVKSSVNENTVGREGWKEWDGVHVKNSFLDGNLFMKKKDELKKLDIESLNQEAIGLKKELFNLKLNINGGEVKDYSQFKKMRKNIARCLTLLNQNKKMG